MNIFGLRTKNIDKIVVITKKYCSNYYVCSRKIQKIMLYAWTFLNERISVKYYFK